MSVLWSIGDPHGGPRQFAGHWFTEKGQPEPTFEVGRSDPTRDWPQVQPGPLDSSWGFAPASVSVVFDAPASSAEHGHTLELALVASHGPCPDLTVTIGTRTGLALLRPRRTDRSGHPSPPSPTSGPAGRDVYLPPGLVTEGTNRLTLTTTLTEPADPGELEPAQLPLGVWFGSALTWHALALRVCDDPPAPAIRLHATPLYVRSEEGAERELVDLVVQGWATSLADTDAMITVGDEQYQVRLEAGRRSFGDLRARFPITPPVTETTAKVTLGRGEHEVTVQFRAARRWTLHLLPHVHLDVGYTDVQAKVLELHHRNVERVLDLLADTPDYTFLVDGSLIFQGYRRSRQERRVTEALDALRAGRLSLNAFYVLFLSGVASLEECYRAAYLAAGLRRDEGVPLRYANLTDVPSYSQAIPSVLAAMGLDAFFGIANHTRAATDDSDELHLRSPLWWEGPDGAAVLSFFSDCYSQLRFICADPPTLTGCADGFSRYVERYDRDDYLPTDLPIVGTHADNEDVAHGYAGLVARWNDRYLYPKLRFSTVAEYLDALAPVADRLPRFRGDGGGHWEDGVGTQAVAIANYRRAQSELPAAEALGALLPTIYDGVQADLESLDRGWERLLLGCEHTWTASHATGQPHSHLVDDELAWTVSNISEARRHATDEIRRGMSQLGERLPTDGPSLVVFNPLPWSATLDVRTEVHAGTAVVDEDGDDVALDTSPPVDRLETARVRVEDVPAFGYRVFPLRKGRRSAAAAPAAVPAVIETDDYVVRLDPSSGRLRSMWDRRRRLELLEQGRDWTVGDVLYVTGGGSAAGRGLGPESTSLFDTEPTLPPPLLSIAPATRRSAVARRTPWSWQIITEGEAPSLPSVRTVTEIDDDGLVRVTVTLVKEPVLAKESVYVAFPFAMSPDPVLRYDRQQGWVNPVEDHYPGAGNEWFTVQHSVCVSDAAHTVMWSSADAPLFVVDDVVRGRWPRRAAVRTGTVLSWVMNNYWFTNTPASQSGTVELRYAFRPADRFDPVAATRLGRHLRLPGLASQVTSLDKGDRRPRELPAAGSLWPIEVPDSVDVSVLAGRLAPGPIVRLREVAGESATVQLPHPSGPGGRAWRCRADEEPLEEVPVDSSGNLQVAVGPYAVVTLALSR